MANSRWNMRIQTRGAGLVARSLKVRGEEIWAMRFLARGGEKFQKKLFRGGNSERLTW